MNYEFKCTQCKHEFEITESMKDTTPTRECPECGAVANKLVGVSAIHFSGLGWSGTAPHEKFDALRGKARKRRPKD